MPGSLASVSALQWLTAEQAVADYANALRFVRQASVIHFLMLGCTWQ